jgi:hypothetical protein
MQFTLSRAGVARALLAISCLVGAAAHAQPLVPGGNEYAVPAAAGPWDIDANPAMPYGIVHDGIADRHKAPVVVPVQANDRVTIKWVKGNPDSGAGIGKGARGVRVYTEGCVDQAPGCFVPRVSYLVQLIGSFADDSGAVIGSPFALNNGPVHKRAPAGATQLLLGFNDNWYNDNSQRVVISVKSEQAVQ